MVVFLQLATSRMLRYLKQEHELRNLPIQLNVDFLIPRNTGHVFLGHESFPS